jgi:UDP-N-acetylglucosamine 2-epimerase
MKKVLEEINPDVVLIHGDTSKTFVTSLGMLLFTNSSWKNLIVKQ